MQSASRKPRIGLYQPYPHSFGGMQAVVLKLAKRLPDFGYEPVIISPEDGGFIQTVRSEKLSFLVCDPGPEWHVYGRGANSFSYLFSIRRLFALCRYWRQLSHNLRQNKIDLLHCNDYRAVMLAAPAARLAGIPVIWHVHGFVCSRLLNLIAAALVQGAVPVSYGMLDYIKLPRWLFGHYRVIHNGLEPAPVSAPSVEESPPPDDTPVILALGRLHPCKGYETLIRAFCRVSAHIPAAECWIVGKEFGDGRYAQQLRNLVHSLGLNGKVKLPGHSSDVSGHLRQCRLLVVPSSIETFGMVAIEAMLAGKPVVACRTGGLQDIVVHRQTGSLVEIGNDKAMSDAILEILNDGALARKMGEAARKRVLEHFSLEKMASSFADFYSTFLQPADGTAEA